MKVIPRFRYAVAMCALPLVALMASGCSQPAEPAADGQPAPPAHAHAVAGETCFICDPSKRDAGRLWCNEHGRYEDRCFLCHPELEESGRLYCTEHYLYEDECFLCHPELRAEPEADAGASKDAALGELTGASDAELSDVLATLFCQEHGVDEIECGICHPELLSGLAVGEGLKVRLASTASARKAGVRVGRPAEAEVAAGIEALGRLSYDGNKNAVVTPLSRGVVRDVFADVGQSVSKDELLAEVMSPAIAEAKNALVKALVDLERTQREHERETELLKREVTSQQEYDSARAAYEAGVSETDRARQQLLNLGLTQDEVASVEKSRSTSSVLPLRAPFGGVVTDREAVLGTAVETGANLFQITDLDTMWLELSVAEMDAARLRAGAEVVVEFDALPGESFEGKLDWIASHVDENTRTVKARAVIANPGHRLKRGMFGRALITENAPLPGVTVPADAVQMVDGRPVVFAKLADDLYETRIVRTGPSADGRMAIVEGLVASDEIALAESYILKSELLKARLGAGCVHD